ncbi:MAG TPA: hypothetical protein VGV37_09740 [Aliidongia sp.]|uniref:hypothetical protein n=1 Tax=Aliidongia sp. TaxID=1914230 RepID=UPI002DDD2A02|nr:hypothetical protein [Aliidongia sp.]HEV2674812.1 hypothetical protein [Aliidongia sp.]
MDLDDPQWSHLCGGYRVPYDPRKAFLALERADETASTWEELWTELHHQGDVGEASYAAVPHLVRIYAARGIANWNTYALVATIEESRRSGHNPELPADLRDAYVAAWGELVKLGLRELEAAREPTLVASIIGVIAFSKGQFTLGRLAVSFTEDERQEMLKTMGWA